MCASAFSRGSSYHEHGRYRGTRCHWAGVFVVLTACAPQIPEPTRPEPPPEPALVVQTASMAAPAQIAVSAPAELPEPGSATPFGVGSVEVRTLAPALFEGAEGAPAASVDVEPVPYERFRHLGTLAVGHSHLSMLDLSADETRLLAVSEAEARLRVYDVESRRLVTQVPVAGYDKFGVGEFLFWPVVGEPQRVLFAGAEAIRLLDPTGSMQAVTLAQESGASLKIQSGLVGSTRGEGPGHGGVLTLYEAESSPTPGLVPVLSVATPERVEDWVLSADRSRLGLVYFPSLAIEWIDLKARRVLWRASAPEFTNSMDLSPDGTLLAVGGKELHVVSVANPERSGVFAEFDNNIHQVHFAPAGDAVAASSYDGHVRIVSTASNSADSAMLTLRKALRHTGTANVYAFRFTRDGRRLYSCSGDRSVRIFGL